MTANAENRELRDRLDLIENMIAEGRRKTESWGWTFVLWGAAYYIAIAWSTFGQQFAVWGSRNLAWPVTMLGTAGLTLVIALGKGKKQPGTTISRAIGAVWGSVGISMVLIFPALALADRLDQHTFVAIVAAMLAVANGASGMILKLKMQIACAVLWWITTVSACFGTDRQVTAVFLAALFLCQIVFGVYMMICESREHSRGAVHA